VIDYNETQVGTMIRGSHVVGTAAYGRFRQFQVNVDETFLIKK
jgi:hypothetical protein